LPKTAMVHLSVKFITIEYLFWVPGLSRVVKNYPGSKLPGNPTGTRRQPYYYYDNYNSPTVSQLTYHLLHFTVANTTYERSPVFSNWFV